MSSITQVAERLDCRAAYLSKAARNHGYSLSRALRWIRFLHAMALVAEGCRVDTVVWRLGFNDVAGWSRFARRLVGRSPRQLPVLPLDHWVRRAVNDVYFGPPASRADTASDRTGLKQHLRRRDAPREKLPAIGTGRII